MITLFLNINPRVYRKNSNNIQLNLQCPRHLDFASLHAGTTAPAAPQRQYAGRGQKRRGHAAADPLPYVPVDRAKQRDTKCDQLVDRDLNQTCRLACASRDAGRPLRKRLRIAPPAPSIAHIAAA
ncbi:hypothetical protein [Burkholderia ubonensis]|uniref:hypothetical protein n=1 Tax=Burkholderia ubonensis TaxID=101571 RepID=UPI001583FA0C|nr:hypothetical protein [Burkholderia ubonensis]